MRLFKMILITVTLGLFTSSAWAMDENHKPMQTDSGLSYVTGGVGDQSQAMLESNYGDYSFKLVNVSNAERAGYVADVEVWITDDNGDNILHTSANGPWLIADLPQGSYSLKATFNGQTQNHDFTVSGDESRRLVLSWDAEK